MNKHTVFGAAATAAVVIALVLGFWNLGGRGRQRQLTADEQRGNDLRSISVAIDQWYGREKKLPADLKALTRYEPGLRFEDPVTRIPYEYMPGSEPQYQLCATFALAAGPGNRRNQQGFSFHHGGRQCFALDALHVSLQR